MLFRHYQSLQNNLQGRLRTSVQYSGWGEKSAIGGTAKHLRRKNEHSLRSAQPSFCDPVVKDHNYTQKPLQAICPHPKLEALMPQDYLSFGKCNRQPAHFAQCDYPGSQRSDPQGSLSDHSVQLLLVTCLEDTHRMIKMLKRNKAGGMNDINAEFILEGREILVAPLKQILTMIFTASFPDEWSVSIITTILKKGDKQDCNNYRGLTVRTALSKLYAIVLNNRLMEWTEKHKLRAIAQAGFRKDQPMFRYCLHL